MERKHWVITFFCNGRELNKSGYCGYYLDAEQYAINQAQARGVEYKIEERL